MEPWINPDIFQATGNNNIVDEYTLGQMLDHGTALTMLQSHWDTWITADDFAAMAKAGLNHVRIPFPYWSVPLTAADTNVSTSTDPYIPGSYPYLLRALNWAKTNNLHVILDLHAAPQSQNGYDNSGQRGTPQWPWKPENVIRTIDTMRFLAKEIGGMIDILELLNEPAGFVSDEFAAIVRQYWLDGYNAVREVDPNLVVMIGDAFLTVNSWEDFLTYPDATGVIMDVHQYQIFSNDQLARSFDEHIAFACSQIPDLVDYATNNIWTINGEWSLAVTDCVKWLNGRNVGSRWDGSISNSQGFGSCSNWTGNYSTFSDEYTTFLRKYYEVQTLVAEKIQGWVFWAWKTNSNDPSWDYSKGLAAGWIPTDPDERLYPNICS